MNRNTQIKVKTAVGMSEIEATGENVAQGSIGGALASSANLDRTLNMFFEGSDGEISYDDVRLNPITFQDDTAHFVTDVTSAQKGNDIMASAMKLKQLSLNVDKCGLILFGSKSNIKKLTSEINSVGGIKLNQARVDIKEEDKYLGDQIHSGGISKSIESTVGKRYGKVIKSIIEAKCVVEDFRANLLGGLEVGIDIWELAIAPSLLHNSDTWVAVNKQTLDMLDNIQNFFLRNLLAVPDSTPTYIMYWDTGMLTMENRIRKSKLLFLHHLVGLEDQSLAKQIFQKQKKMNLPGPVQEFEELLKLMKLPNIIDNNTVISKSQWKKIVKTAILEENEKDLKEKMSSYTKIEDGPQMKEKFEKRMYLNIYNVTDARLKFRMRSMMIPAKMNMRSKEPNSRTLWKCDDCGNVDTQGHILWCPAYSGLRQGRDLANDKDIVDYFREVLKHRDDYC